MSILLPDRISQASTADTAQTLSLTTGTTQGSGYYGHTLKPVLFVVHWGSAVSSIQHKVTLNSGLGSTYDVILKDELFTGQDWIWSIQEELPGFTIMPDDTSSTTNGADALDLLVEASPSGSVISYAAILYEIME